MFNIRTFVIGAPGSETARALLSELAYLGGTATTADCAYGGGDPAVGDCHFDLTSSGGGADAGADGGAGTDFAAALADALKAIAAQAVVTCQYDVPTGGRVDRSGVIITLAATDPRASVTCEPADGDCANGATGIRSCCVARLATLPKVYRAGSPSISLATPVLNNTGVAIDTASP